MRAVTPEGVDEVLLSPDGRSLAGVVRGKGVWVFPIAPADGAPVTGTTKSDLPAAHKHLVGGHGREVRSGAFPG